MYDEPLRRSVRLHGPVPILRPQDAPNCYLSREQLPPFLEEVSPTARRTGSDEVGGPSQITTEEEIGDLQTPTSRFYRLDYEFTMDFDGLLAKSRLECTKAKKVVEVSRSITPIYKPGTC